MYEESNILFYVFLLAVFAVGTGFEVTQDRFPTISVIYQEKEEVSILNRTLLLTGINKEINLTDNISNPIITDPDPFDGILTYTFLYKPDTPLENGEYLFTIIASDKVGNNRTKFQQFTVNILFTDIFLINPPYGVTSITPFDLRIRTTENMEGCRYQISPFQKTSFTPYQDLQTSKFSSSDSINFYISNFDKLGDSPPFAEDVQYYLYVTCNDTLGIVNDNSPKEFTLLLDNSAPLINVIPDPNPVVNDPVTVNIIAQSLRFSNNIIFNQTKIDRINCRFSNFSDKSYDNMEYKFYQDNSFFNETNNIILTSAISSYYPSIQTGNNYTYYVQCKNRAGLLSDIKQVNFKVDTSLGSNITHYAPSGYVKTQNTLINITTNRPATCSYTKAGESFSTNLLGNNKDHTSPLNNLSDGAYTYHILCNFPGAQSRTGDLNFIVDTSNPNPPIVSPYPACSRKQITARITSDDSDIKYFQYRLTDGTNTLIDYTNGSAVNNQLNLRIENLNLDIGRTYYLKVIAYDFALNPSNEVTAAIVSLDNLTDPICTEKIPPTLSVTYTVNTSEATISINCVDQSGCREVAYSYIATSQNCNAYTDTYTSSFKEYSSGKVCYRGEDMVGNTANGSQVIYLSNPVDEDSDGFQIELDCNDNNAAINPNATETPYDSIDQNCDGFDLADLDGDSYCKAGYHIQNATLQCPKETGTIGADCNDNSLLFGRHINPGVPEVCGNNIDDNCNGQIDENCGCTQNTDCNDNLFCTQDRCVSGKCNFILPTDCADSKSCSNDVCDEVQDICIHESANCTCSSRTQCDDGNPCTTEECVNNVCESSFNTNSCNDNNFCTAIDKCSAGKCGGNKTLDCSDSKTCSFDVCDPKIGCVNNMVKCDCDTDADCADSDPCTINRCNILTGQCQSSSLMSAGTSCGNLLFCEIDDECNAAGGCVGKIKDCSSLLTCSLQNTCSESTKSCTNILTSCGCTLDSDCSDGNICTNDVCGTDGICKSIYNKIICDDGNVCTANDKCDEGICIGAQNPSCNPFSIDNDADGYPVGSDCNDNNLSINPGVNEVCTGGVDDNCDGNIDCKDAQCANDNSCKCTIGAWTTCGPNKGVCANKTGIMTCDGSGAFGIWSACKNPAVPGIENCSSILDENCNGLAGCNDPVCSNSPACKCSFPSQMNCGINIGICKYGVKSCMTDQKWGACTGGVLPTSATETDCGDEKDNDCNGLTDCKDTACSLASNCIQCSPDNSTDICGEVGNITQICQQGTRTCNKGLWSECVGLILPKPDICKINGEYDGCSGETQNCSISPENQIDIDSDGYTVSEGDCNDYDSSIYPGGKEFCDGFDNDCDGKIDNNCVDEENNGIINTTNENNNQTNETENIINSETTNDGYAKQHLLGIILLILGLLMIFGAGGYLLYKKYMKKGDSNAYNNSGFLFSSPDQNPQDQNSRLPNQINIMEKQKSEHQKMQDILNKRIALQNAIQSKRREGKIKERKGVLSSFDANQKKIEPITENKEEITLPKNTNLSEDTKKIMANIIKRQQERKSLREKDGKQQLNKTVDEKLESIIKKDSIFDNLDKMGKGKSDEQVKEKLNTLIHADLTEEKLEKMNLKSKADIKDIDKLIDNQSDKKRKKEVFKDLSKIKDGGASGRKQIKKSKRK